MKANSKPIGSRDCLTLRGMLQRARPSSARNAISFMVATHTTAPSTRRLERSRRWADGDAREAVGALGAALMARPGPPLGVP